MPSVNPCITPGKSSKINACRDKSLVKGIKHKDLASLLEYSLKFIGLTISQCFELAKSLHPEILGDKTPDDFIENPKDKGNLGKLIETFLYGISNNCESKPDFNSLIESGEKPPDLKCTKFHERKDKKGWRCHFRVSCTQIGTINTHDLEKRKQTRQKFINEKTLNESSYKEKCTKMLLVIVEEGKKSTENLWDKKIMHVALVDLYEDYSDVLEKDYSLIRNVAIDNDKLISGKKKILGTSALECCPKGKKGGPECTRAFALYAPFITGVIAKDMEKRYNRTDLFHKKGNQLYIDFSKAKPITVE